MEASEVLGGSCNLVSRVISTLIGVISTVTLLITSVTKSHDPPSTCRWSLARSSARFAGGDEARWPGLSRSRRFRV